VLVTAAAGRIGSLLVQRAQAAGATTVIGAVGSPQKAVAAAGLGADVVVDYTAPDWVAKVKQAAGGKGADVVLDAIGGDIAAQALEATANGGGRFGLYGFTSGTWVQLDAHQIGRRGITVVGARGITFAKPVEEQRADAAEALKAAAAGQLVPRIDGSFPLERAADAHRAVESRGSVGAVLINP
jgi:NADPH2:quinone reductase